MSRIIALIDGSLYAKSVCDYSAWIAERTGAGVDLLHILGRRETESAPANLSGSVGLGARSSLLAELGELDAQRAKLAQQRGWAILEDGEAALESAGVHDIAVKLRFGDLLETMEKFEPDARVIVIGKRGEGADFAKGHLGSNLERIVRASQKPVFVASREYKPVKRILIAYDGGASSRKAVEMVASSPLFEGLAIRLLMAGPESAENRKALDDAKSRFADSGREAETEIVSGQPEKLIGEIVEGGGADLLVMGAYGHSRIRNLIIGSTTAEMVRSCKIPVLLFR